MMKVHLRVLRCGMKVDHFVFSFRRRDRVGFRPTSEYELRWWPSVLRDVVFLRWCSLIY